MRNLFSGSGPPHASSSSQFSEENDDDAGKLQPGPAQFQANRFLGRLSPIFEKPRESETACDVTSVSPRQVWSHGREQRLLQLLHRDSVLTHTLDTSSSGSIALDTSG